jgi:hypothetical protein
MFKQWFQLHNKQAETAASEWNPSTRRLNFISLHIVDGGFELRNSSDCIASVRWDSVVKVIAYKWDCWSSDLICLGFFIPSQVDSEEMLQVHEEMLGFADFRGELPKHFEGMDLDWYHGVMFPALEACMRVVWQKSHQNLT